ncbi:MAG TPA: serine hydrolase domain-containing protein [Candidatus Baltobacteraceae bacterium]|nr:serine hydrolase domain-containing protein [Candidatus Baltobacteraceae bacterium]
MTFGRRAWLAVIVIAVFLGESIGAARGSTGSFIRADDRAALRSLLPSGTGAVIVLGYLAPDGTRSYDVITPPSGTASGIGPHSLFEVGSITKTFTAIALAHMVRAGAIALSSPIQTYLPAGVRAPTFDGEQITVQDLADHHSGLPRMPPGLVFARPGALADYTSAQSYAALAAYKLTRAPGSQYEYSNWGVGLLGQLLATRAGTSYAHLVERAIIDPLRLRDTSVPAPNATAGDIVAGYDADGNPQPYMTWNGSLAGAGAIRSSVSDLLTLGSACLPGAGTPISGDCAFAIEPRADAGKQKARVGLVWETQDQDKLVWHNGDTLGYHGFLGIDPVHHTVLAMLSNVSVFMDYTALHVLDPSFPVPRTPPPLVLPAAKLAAYEGRYRLADGSHSAIIVEEDAQGLRMRDGRGQHFALTAIAPDTFRTRENETLTFCTRADGSVYAVVTDQYGKIDVATRS